MDRDHDGSLLENLGGLFGGGLFGGESTAAANPPAPAKAIDGGSILSHIFGNKRDRVGESVSRGSGLDRGQAMKLMMMLAPLVLAYLGRRKRQEQLNGDQLGEHLQTERRSVEAGGGGFLGRMLDQDGDGDFDMMDVIKFGAGKLFRR